MGTPVYVVEPLDVRGLLVGVEAILLGALAGHALGETVHMVFRISMGVAVFFVYPYVYVIRYVGVVVNAIVSLLYAALAGYITYGAMLPKVDRIWIGFASVVVLVLSLYWHRLVVEVVREQDPARLLRLVNWIRSRRRS